MKLPTPAKLATEFAKVLMDWLTPEQWREMCIRNRNEASIGVCHSHDHCDANMAMDAAFRKLGIEPLPDLEAGMTDEVMSLWNEAWDYAKFHYIS